VPYERRSYNNNGNDSFGIGVLPFYLERAFGILGEGAGGQERDYLPDRHTTTKYRWIVE